MPNFSPDHSSQGFPHGGGAQPRQRVVRVPPALRSSIPGPSVGESQGVRAPESVKDSKANNTNSIAFSSIQGSTRHPSPSVRIGPHTPVRHRDVRSAPTKIRVDRPSLMGSLEIRPDKNSLNSKETCEVYAPWKCLIELTDS